MILTAREDHRRHGDGVPLATFPFHDCCGSHCRVVLQSTARPRNFAYRPSLNHSQTTLATLPNAFASTLVSLVVVWKMTDPGIGTRIATSHRAHRCPRSVFVRSNNKDKLGCCKKRISMPYHRAQLWERAGL